MDLQTLCHSARWPQPLSWPWQTPEQEKNSDARLKGASKNFAGATIRPGVEDAVNPSLEASWRHPWRQDLHTGADGGAGKVFRCSLKELLTQGQRE
ncbi:hypothetical protein HH1059_00940 [Halorhodospira halochloris]|uniref:Uncharacterized protein n=1 Tax=Halorhodospira halochloris TaxID=1052 RepID=A0A2Z6EZ71_HALHR|nr:hypothetical protein HH1059_00940 [Halorhodospira halochloris]